MTIADEPVLHGYTMGDIDRIARTAVVNRYSGGRRSSTDADELFEAAWGAIVELLCSSETAPAGQDLYVAGVRGVTAVRGEINRHRGVDLRDPWSGTYAARGFLRYWIDPWPGSPVEDAVVDRLAVLQVMAGLNLRERDHLLLLALHDGDVAAAASMSGCVSYRALVTAARHAAQALWHDGETPVYRSVWARSSRRAMRPCGTLAAYQRHKRRRERPCEDCRRVSSELKARQYQERKARAGAS